MGHGIAESALLAGYRVNLQDVRQEFVDRGVKRIGDSLDKFVSKGIVPDAQRSRIMGELLKPHTDLKKAVEEADLVIEAVSEVLELKQKVFREIDKMASPHAVLASNSSTISITQIASATNRAEKVLGLHYFNPVVFMKLVEVVKGGKTSEETMQIGYDFALKNNKAPVRVHKDVPGFIVNRIQVPGIVLVHCILDEGADPEAVDAVFRNQGIPMGPCETMDYTGLDINVNVLRYFAEKLHPDFAPGRVVEGKVRAGQLGKKTGLGLFDWSNGRPEINLSKAAGNVDPMDITATVVNEATKIIKLGVCSAEDVNMAIINGTGVKTGPMTTAKTKNPAELAERLERLAKRFKKDIFMPTDMIRDGEYLK